MAQTCRLYIGEEQFVWEVGRLWALVRDSPVTMFPVRDFQPVLDCELLTPIRTFLEVAEHAQRIVEADLAYPLILSAEGVIMDGRHRLMKAWMLRRETVAVVRFPVNPPPDQRLSNAAAATST